MTTGMVYRSFKMKVWTSNFQWNLMMPKSDDPKGISIGSRDFDNPKVYGDTSIFDDLVMFRVVVSYTYIRYILKAE